MMESACSYRKEEASRDWVAEILAQDIRGKQKMAKGLVTLEKWAKSETRRKTRHLELRTRNLSGPMSSRFKLEHVSNSSCAVLTAAWKGMMRRRSERVRLNPRKGNMLREPNQPSTLISSRNSRKQCTTAFTSSTLPCTTHSLPCTHSMTLCGHD